MQCPAITVVLQASGFRPLVLPLLLLEPNLLPAPGVDCRLHGSAYVELSPFPGKLHLALPLGVAFYLILAVLIVTIVTTHTFLIMLALLVLPGNRHATGMTLIIATLLQIVIDGYPIVEDKALALPFAFCLGHLFQILQLLVQK